MQIKDCGFHQKLPNLKLNGKDIILYVVENFEATLFFQTVFNKTLN